MQTKGGRNRPYRLEIEHVNGKRLTGSTWDSLDGALTEAKGLVESESSRVEAVRIFYVVQGRWSFLRAVRKTDEQQQLQEIARGGIESHLGDVLADYEMIDGHETEFADTVYDEAYTLAHDALISAGVDADKAREVAQYVAQCYAQP